MERMTTVYRYRNNKWVELNYICDICKKIVAKKNLPTHTEVCKSINTLSIEEIFMPIHRITKGGETYYRWGDHGKLYKDRKDAEKQAAAAHAAGYKEPMKKDMPNK